MGIIILLSSDNMLLLITFFILISYLAQISEGLRETIGCDDSALKFQIAQNKLNYLHVVFNLIDKHGPVFCFTRLYFIFEKNACK